MLLVLFLSVFLRFRIVHVLLNVGHTSEHKFLICLAMKVFFSDIGYFYVWVGQVYLSIILGGH